MQDKTPFSGDGANLLLSGTVELKTHELLCTTDFFFYFYVTVINSLTQYSVYPHIFACNHEHLHVASFEEWIAVAFTGTVTGIQTRVFQSGEHPLIAKGVEKLP